MLESHKTDLSAKFRIVISVLESKIDLVYSTVSSNRQRIASLEFNSDLVSEHLTMLETKCVELTASKVELRARTTDPEARSRRIIGVPEWIEGLKPTAFFSKLLSQLLGEEVLSAPPELGRAHRSLTLKPRRDEKPRPVIIQFHNYQTKEKVILEAQKRRLELQYEHYTSKVVKPYHFGMVWWLRQRMEIKCDFHLSRRPRSIFLPITPGTDYYGHINF